jgi:hypothetical protein
VVTSPAACLPSPRAGDLVFMVCGSGFRFGLPGKARLGFKIQWLGFRFAWRGSIRGFGAARLQQAQGCRQPPMARPHNAEKVCY